MTLEKIFGNIKKNSFSKIAAASIGLLSYIPSSTPIIPVATAITIGATSVLMSSCDFPFSSSKNKSSDKDIDEDSDNDDNDDGDSDSSENPTNNDAIKSIGVNYALNPDNNGILIYTDSSRNPEGFNTLRLNHSDGTTISENVRSVEGTTNISRSIASTDNKYYKDFTLDGIITRFYYGRFVDGSIDIIDKSNYDIEMTLLNGTVKNAKFHLEKETGIVPSTTQSGKIITLNNYSSYDSFSIVSFDSSDNSFFAYDMKSNKLDVISLCDLLKIDLNGNLEFFANAFSSNAKYSHQKISVNKLSASLIGQGTANTYDSSIDGDISFDINVAGTTSMSDNTIDSYVLAKTSGKAIYGAALDSNYSPDSIITYIVPFSTRGNRKIPAGNIDISSEAYIIFIDDIGKYSLNDEIDSSNISSMKRYDIE